MVSKNPLGHSLLTGASFSGTNTNSSISFTKPTTGLSGTSGLSLFSDSACTKTLTNINWGFIYPGESANYVVYVKNVGTLPLSMSLETSNWNPNANYDLLSIIWNRNGFVLLPGQSIVSILTLSVNPTTRNITTFSVDITISGHA